MALIEVQCREKVFAPFLFFYFFASLSHMNDSDHQTNFNITQRYMISFINGKSCPNLPGPTWKSNCNNWLCHPLQQQLQSSVYDNWQWVFHIAVEEFWPTLLCRIVLIQPYWSFFKHEWWKMFFLCFSQCHEKTFSRHCMYYWLTTPELSVDLYLMI